jgi:NAD(P)-dependent dehydrogenase (short-subunit alcohol dehydrogenase family)
MELDNRVAIVTGAAQGIGRAIAYVLAQEGARVVIADINSQGAEKVAEELRALGGQALAIQADVSRDEEVERMVRRTVEEFGGIDIVVNNAFYNEFTFGEWAEIDPAEWGPAIETTFKSVLRTSKAVIPHMKQKNWGRIINIASEAGKIAAPGVAVYSACKGAVIAFSRTLALEVARYGILVNCVSPGLIETASSLKTPPEVQRDFIATIPLGRIGQPDEIGHIVAFLASEKASFITGQNYSVNGGSCTC